MKEVLLLKGINNNVAKTLNTIIPIENNRLELTELKVLKYIRISIDNNERINQSKLKELVLLYGLR